MARIEAGPAGLRFASIPAGLVVLLVVKSPPAL
jgi:hypothetical protein